MKNSHFKSKKSKGWLAAVIFIIAAATDLAQQLPNGQGSAFTTDTYYEHPNEQQVQMKLSGAEATPLPGGLLDIKDLKVETFETNGTLQVTAKAPQCTYALLDGKASSEGHLEAWSGDGKFQIAGDGFLILLRKNAMSLTLSNHVHTVIKTGMLTP